MEQQQDILQRISDVLVGVWTWVWQGWSAVVSWLIQGVLPQIGITIRDTGDEVNYISGLIAIVGAIVALARYLWPSPPATKPMIIEGYKGLNGEITQLIIVLRQKNLDAAHTHYNEFMKLLHTHKYVFPTLQRNELFVHWRATKKEYHAIRRVVTRDASAKISTAKHAALQAYIQRQLAELTMK